MIETVLSALLPVAFAIALGWLSGRLGYLKHEDADVFATFVLRFALPLALFLGAVKTPPEKLHDMRFALCLAFGLMGSYLVALFAGLCIFKRDLKTSTIQALVCGFPDMAYFGAPVLQTVIGPEGFFAVLIGNLVTSLIMLPLTIMLIRAGDKAEAGHGMKHVLLASFAGAVMNPIVWLPVLGIAFSFMHVKLPGPALASAEMIATAAGGASLFALGLMFYGERFRFNADILTNIGLKNFLQPALMFLGVLALGLKGPLAHEAIITGAVPTATAASMFALRNRTYTAEASGTILISTLLGILTEAGLIILFSVMVVLPPLGPGN